MTCRDRRRLGVLVSGLLLGAGLILSYASLADARRTAAADLEELRKVRSLQKGIRALQGRPRRAETTEIELSALTRTIEASCSAAGFPTEHIVRIDPQSAHRVGDGPYKEKPTRVEIQRVGLQQVVSFLYGLCSDGRGLKVREIRLRTPHGEELGTDWLVEIALSYLIYDPQRGS